MNYAYEIFRLFYPERCAACGRSLPEGARLLCPRCRWDMPLTGYSAEHDNPVARKFWGLVPVQEACSMIFFTQGNAYRSMIHGFKYRGQWRTALRLGRWFGTELRESGLYGDVDVVVPVPLHYRRLLSRGYNQAEYFGRGIAEALGVPLDARSVVRSGYNRSQARMADRSERWDNVKGIFSVRRPASLAGRHLLLVDDVLTTGATLAGLRRSDRRGRSGLPCQHGDAGRFGLRAFRRERQGRLVGVSRIGISSGARPAVSCFSDAVPGRRNICRRGRRRDVVQRDGGAYRLFAQPVGFRRHSGMLLEKTAEKGGVREIQVVGYLLDGHLRGTQLGLGIENHRLGYPFGHAPVADLLDHRGEVLRCQTQFPGIESRCPLFPVVAHDKLHEPFEDFLVAGQPAVVLRMFGLIQRC